MAVSPIASDADPSWVFQKPVVLEVGLIGRGVQQETGRGFVTLDADLGFERTDLIEPHDLDVLQLEEPEIIQALPVGVVPKDDAMPLLVEESGECGVDLAVVHQAPSV